MLNKIFMQRVSVEALITLQACFRESMNAFILTSPPLNGSVSPRSEHLTNIFPRI